MTHLEGRILLDSIIDIFAILIGYVIVMSISKDSINRRGRSTYDYDKLPKTQYKDYNWWDKFMMSFIPEHASYVPTEENIDTSSPNRMSVSDSVGVQYKVYKNHRVIITANREVKRRLYK
jgi:hypothetical protein